MLWTDSPIHFVDFEGNRECGVIEYGVATLLNREIVATQTRLCMAYAEIRSIESQLHGIHNSATQNKSPFSDEWEYFNQLRKSGPLAAHHASTENNLLKMVWPYPTYSPDFLNTDLEIAEWGPWLDTWVIALNIDLALHAESRGSPQAIALADAGVRAELHEEVLSIDHGFA